MGVRELSRWERRNRSVAYPVLGGLISIAIPSVLLGVRAFIGGSLSAASVVGELLQQPFTYAYLLTSTAGLMMLLGWLAGRREDALQRLSGVDVLTGLANRRRLESEFFDEVKRTTRYGTPMAVLLVDLDRLKAINDFVGHRAGDKALRMVAEALVRSCRATDLVARWGGDEFVVLAGNTTAVEALALAHRIRATLRRVSIEESRKPRAEALGVCLSVSIGAADLDRAEETTLESMMAAADRALYSAKAEGRDRVVVASAVTPSARMKMMTAQLRGTAENT